MQAALGITGQTAGTLLGRNGLYGFLRHKRRLRARFLDWLLQKLYRYPMSIDGSAQPVLKRFWIEPVLGALVGLLLWSLGGPAVISWWYQPPSRDAFSCAGSVEQALGEFVKFQLGSAVFGAVGLFILGYVWRRSRAKKTAKPVESKG